MQKTLLFIICVIFIIIVGFLTVLFNTNPKDASKTEKETALNQAKHLFEQKLSRGEDLSSGPCLSNALMPDWVVDVVHNPRLAIDDLQGNQCPAYIEGRAKHFIELDLEGNLVRIK